MSWEAAMVRRGPAVFLLEYRVGAVEETDLARMHQVLLHALARLVTAGVAIRYTHGLFVPEDRRCVYLLEAAEPASVVRAADIAGLPLAQVRSAIDLAALSQPGTQPAFPTADPQVEVPVPGRPNIDHDDRLDPNGDVPHGGSRRPRQGPNQAGPAGQGGTMSTLEVSARMKVRDGQLEGFKQQAAECVRQTKEKDTRTLRYDWFLSSDGTECEIREVYVDSDGLLEHRANIGDALDRLFTEFADDHRVTVYGDPSPELVQRADVPQMRGKVSWYCFLQGLAS